MKSGLCPEVAFPAYRLITKYQHGDWNLVHRPWIMIPQRFLTLARFSGVIYLPCAMKIELEAYAPNRLFVA
jgi:hypothetical protein